jgi:hypothetical protein
LIAAEREMRPARLSRFEKPADPRTLWIEHPLEGVPDLEEVNSVETADFDADGKPDILIAEKGGQGRLMVLRNAGEGRFEPVTVAQGRPIRFALPFNPDGDARPGILAIRDDAIIWFRPR